MGSAVKTSEEQQVDVTHHPPGPEAFPGATARSHWTGRVATRDIEALITLDHALGTTCLTTGPEQTTLHLRHDDQEEGPGALMMKAAVGEVEGGEGVHLPATQSTSLDTNQEQGGMNATL